MSVRTLQTQRPGHRFEVEAHGQPLVAELQSLIERMLPLPPIGRVLGAAVTIAIAPIVVSLPLTVLQRTSDAESAGWIALFSVVTVGVLLLTRYEWANLLNLNNDIDVFLNTPENRAHAIRYVARYGSRTPQLVSVGIGILLATGSLFLLDMRDLLPTQTSAASYAVVALAGGLLTCTVYGGIFAALMIRLMFRLTDVETPRIIPAASPAVRGLTYLFVTSAVGAALLFGIISFPLSYVAWQSDFNRDVLVVLGVLYVGGLTWFAFGVGLPQYWLSRIVSRERNDTIIEIQSEIWRLSRSTESNDIERLATLLDLLDTVMASPTSTISRLTRFGSALAVAVAPILIAEVVRNLST